MELFYTQDIKGGICTLGEEESQHCVKVLRHREGDTIHIMDGEGTLFTCRLLDASARCATAQVLEYENDWGSHPYRLTMAVCPTKNSDRFEWFAEKGTEMGLDSIVPVIGDHSERKVFKADRLRRILLSAAKQSLKAAVPQVREAAGVKDFIAQTKDTDAVKLIAYCFEGEAPRISIKEALQGCEGKEIIVLIGPEGDFSKEEAEAAVQAGYVPVHLGESRLRTETAALAAVAAVYFHHMK